MLTNDFVKQVSTAPGNVQNTYREVQAVKCPGIGSTISLQIAEVGPLYRTTLR
jgi:hypothetical protein